MLILPVALTDLSDSFFGVFGINSVGVVVYTVVFSSVTVWTAIIRCVFLRKRLPGIQWAAVLLVTLGLAVTAAAGEAKSFDKRFLFGCLATLAAALADAFMYVLSEWAMAHEDGPSEEEVCAGIGATNLVITLLYIGAYSAFGDFRTFVLDPIHQSGDHKSVGTVFGLWGVMAIILLAHYLSFYYVVNTTSSVAAGVNKAMQSIGVFVISDVLFCHRDAAECFSVYKGLSCLLVTAGTLLYAYAGSKPARQEQEVGQEASLTEAVLQRHVAEVEKQEGNKSV